MRADRLKVWHGKNCDASRFQNGGGYTEHGIRVFKVLEKAPMNGEVKFSFAAMPIEHISHYCFAVDSARAKQLLCLAHARLRIVNGCHSRSCMESQIHQKLGGGTTKFDHLRVPNCGESDVTVHHAKEGAIRAEILRVKQPMR